MSIYAVKATAGQERVVAELIYRESINRKAELEAEGGQVYTRDGAFALDASQTLVSSNGAPVQVFAADDAGNISEGTLSNLVIPLGTASEAIPTTSVIMDGRLDNATVPATAGAVATSQPLVTAAGTAATAATALTDLVDPGSMPLFAAGDVLTIQGTKGGIATRESTFIVGETGSSLGDLATYLEQALGIDMDPEAGGTPGVTIARNP